MTRTDEPNKPATCAKVLAKVLASSSVDEVNNFDPMPSRRVLHRVHSELENLGKMELAVELEEKFLARSNSARRRLGPGDSRTLKVQFANGYDYVRIPTAAIGAHHKDGDLVVVEYGHMFGRFTRADSKLLTEEVKEL